MASLKYMLFLLCDDILKSSKETGSDVSFSGSESKFLKILSSEDDNTQYLQMQ
jgi:hypothetical protein